MRRCQLLWPGSLQDSSVWTPNWLNPVAQVAPPKPLFSRDKTSACVRTYISVRAVLFFSLPTVFCAPAARWLIVAAGFSANLPLLLLLLLPICFFVRLRLQRPRQSRSQPARPPARRRDEPPFGSSLARCKKAEMENLRPFSDARASSGCVVHSQ